MRYARRPFLVLRTLACGVLFAACLPAAAQDITSNLTGQWRLLESSGTTAVDASGAGNNGTYTNGVSLATGTTVPNIGAIPAKFDGSNDYVAIPNESSFDYTGAMTVAAWIKIDTWSSQWQAIVTKGDSAWRLTRDSSNNGVTFACSGLSTTRVASSVSMADGNWHHVVGVYTGSQLRIYVDGTLSNSTSSTGSITTNAYNVRIGNNAETAGKEFDGAIFDVRIYNRALSSTDVSALYNQNLKVGHWKLNESSGTTAADSSDYNHPGTVTGTAAWGSAVLNNGFQFNGSTKIQATGLFGNPKNVSVAAWANLTTADSSGAEIISLGDHFRLRLDDGGAVKASMYNGSSYLNVTFTGTYAGTGWHHFAATFDDDNNSFKLYIDGALVATASNTSSINYSGLGTNTVIGRHGNAGTTSDFTGTIDDVRVYNYALSADEVATLYGFIGYWKLAESSGTTAADSSYFAKNGTVTGGANWSTRCNGTGTFDFNGTSHYISVPNAANLQPTEALTVTAWIKGDAWGSGSEVSTIVRKGDATPNNYAFHLCDGKLALCLDEGDTNGTKSSIVLSTGTWYHVAATWDGTTVKLYINGALDTSAARSGTIDTDTRALYIGGRTGSQDFFDGNIQEVRLYNRALSASEISELAGLEGYWKFSEGSGTTAADSSGGGNNVTLSGATWTTDCAGYTALATNGTGGIASTASDFTPPDMGTVAFWMKSSGSPAATARLFGLGGDWEVRQSTDGTLSFDLCGDATPDVISTFPLNEVGRWYHVVETFDSSNDTYAIYIDGQLNKSGTNSNAMVAQTAEVLSFGTRTGSTEYWNGALRDFRVYNRKLCASEIAELYGLVGYWALDESSGTTASDSSGLGRPGTVSGTATWTSGKINNAFSFNGTSSISISSLLGKSKNVTLAAWAKLTTADTSGAEVVSLGDSISIRLDASGNTQARFYNGSTWTTVGFAQTYTGAGWHHFAAVFDDDHDYCRLYVDGVQKANVSTTSSIAYTQGTSTVIGKHGNGNTAMDFTGLIDDVRVYNRPLCATEVQRLYGSGGTAGVRITKWVEIQ